MTLPLPTIPARILAEAVPSGAVAVFTHARFRGWGRGATDGTGYRREDLGAR